MTAMREASETCAESAVVFCPLERAIVARGRTVIADDPSKPRVIDPQTGRQMGAPATRIFGPGQEVELPSDEILRLRADGFLVDPNAPEVPTEPGLSNAEHLDSIRRRPL